MNPTYFLSNFVPIAIALFIIWRGNIRLLRKMLPALGLLALVGLVNALAENPALHWGIWHYNTTHTLGIRIFKVFFETYVYCLLVPIAIGSGAIKFAERQDAKRKK